MSRRTNCFEKQLNPFSLSDMSPPREKITLIEKDEILGNNEEISEILNNFFSCVVAKLSIPK